MTLGPQPLGEQERAALNLLAKGLPLQRGAAWLRSAHISGPSGYGWAHLATHDTPTTWGGTLDGVRGLLATGTLPTDPLIARSIEWILSQQNPDGGWGSREISYSAAEATAWVLIMLREAGFPLTDPRVGNAVKFLETCIGGNGEVATSPSDSAEPRTLPSILTVWALRGLSNKVPLVVHYVKDLRDQAISGWPNRQGAPPNVMATSMVLLTLLTSGDLNRNDIIVRNAIAYLFSQQLPDGSWANTADTWFSKNEPQIPIRCDHYSTNWVLPALIAAGVPVTEPRVAQATRWLVEAQDELGFWMFDPSEGALHVWCAANCLIALARARQELISTDDGLAAAAPLALTAPPPTLLPTSRFGAATRWVRLNITNILLAFMFLYILRQPIGSFIATILAFLKLQRDDLVTEVVGSFFWATLSALLIYMLQKVRLKGG